MKCCRERRRKILKFPSAWWLEHYKQHFMHSVLICLLHDTFEWIHMWCNWMTWESFTRYYFAAFPCVVNSSRVSLTSVTRSCSISNYFALERLYFNWGRADSSMPFALIAVHAEASWWMRKERVEPVDASNIVQSKRHANISLCGFGGDLVKPMCSSDYFVYAHECLVFVWNITKEGHGKIQISPGY